ncbi:MAG: cysteine synthase A [Sedimentisphaerales bacterium]
MQITQKLISHRSDASTVMEDSRRTFYDNNFTGTGVPGRQFQTIGLSIVTSNILDLIGNTPLMQLKGERVFAKAEFLNPGGSIKDRVAFAMLDDARREGKLNDQTIVCEPTSGNTGIGLALVGRIMGYRVRIVMPKGMSEERKKLIRALGAELVLTPDEEGISGAIRLVREMAEQDSRIYIPQQFENPVNPRAHYEQTARELWHQMQGRIDCFVAGVGSGGTLQGVGKFLKEQNKKIKIVAVEPENCSALMGHEPGLHQIQGIGDGFIPAVLDTSLIDDVIEVSDDAAIETTKDLSRDSGLLVGISSGANVWAARQLTFEISGNITTVLPDRAERYFSTALM